MSECQGFFGCVQVKTLLKDRLNGKDTGGSSEKSESTASVELTSRNFDELVVKSKELWVVEFFAPWYVMLNDTDFVGSSYGLGYLELAVVGILQKPHLSLVLFFNSVIFA